MAPSTTYSALVAIFVVMVLHVSYVNSSEGNQFAFALPPSFGEVELILNSKEEATATITFPDQTTAEINVPAYSSTSYVIDGVWRPENDVENLGFTLESDQSISVHLVPEDYNGITHTQDATVLRPRTGSTDEFYIAGYGYGSELSADKPKSFYMVVAYEDDTSVQVYSPGGTGDLDADVTLQKHEVFTRDAWHITDGHLIDYTGARVVADKSVAVFSGHGCSDVNVQGNDYRYQYDSIPSDSSFGVNYTTFPTEFGSDLGGSTIRVIAATDDTTVNIPGLGFSGTIDGGEFYEFTYSNSRDGTTISCSAPCMAVQYVKTNYAAGTTPSGISSFMVILVPDAGLTDDVVFHAPAFASNRPSTLFGLSLVTNFQPTASRGLFLNSDNLENLDWQANVGSTWVATMEMTDWVAVDYRLYTEFQEDKVTAYLHSVYGSNPFHSMGYTVGYYAEAGDDPDPVPPRQTPKYEMILRGNFTSGEGGEDFTQQCIDDLSSNFRDKATFLIPSLNAMIGTDLCLHVAPGDVTIISVSALLVAQGPVGGSQVVYRLEGDPNIRLVDLTSCSSELGVYLEDFNNWGQPVIPPVAGCPEPVFDPEYFFDGSTGNDWVCDGQYVSAMDNHVPGYSLSIYDDYITVDDVQLEPECTQQYRFDWQSKADAMTITLNGMIDNREICEEEVTILTTSTTFTSAGTAGSLTAKFFMSIASDEMRFVDVHGCVDEIWDFVKDHESWGSLPLLPQPPGCPAIDFGVDQFDHDGDRWECPA